MCALLQYSSMMEHTLVTVVAVGSHLPGSRPGMPDGGYALVDSSKCRNP